MKNLWRKLVQYLFNRTQVDEKVEKVVESTKTKIEKIEEKVKKTAKPKPKKK